MKLLYNVAVWFGSAVFLYGLYAAWPPLAFIVAGPLFVLVGLAGWRKETTVHVKAAAVPSKAMEQAKQYLTKDRAWLTVHAIHRPD